MMPRHAIALLALLTCAAALDADPALVARCDGLVESAVRKPYGWAWSSAAEPLLPDGKPRPLPRDAAVISLEPGATPAMALTLHEAGLTLKRDDYLSAARQVARGILAAQDPAGRIPGSVIFAAAVTRLDGTQPIPDRAPTCAALGLMLRILQHQPEDEQLRRGAARAALWLMRQQTPTGLWTTLHTPAEPDEKSARITRLDGRDYRDCTIALLYAARVLDNQILRRAGERSAQQLARLGLQQSRTAQGLWHTAYELNGQPSQRLAAHARTIDALASRYSLQTLLAACVLTGDRKFLPAAQTAADSLRKLQYDDGLWQRLYQFRDGDVDRAPGPAPKPGEVFTDPNAKLSELDLPGAFGLPETLKAVQTFINDRTAECAAALTLVGTTDFPETASVPTP